MGGQRKGFRGKATSRAPHGYVHHQGHSIPLLSNRPSKKFLLNISCGYCKGKLLFRAVLVRNQGACSQMSYRLNSSKWGHIGAIYRGLL